MAPSEDTEDYGRLLERARADIEHAILAWTEALRETLGERLSYVYAKGSAVKRWDSPIDYVPILSDLTSTSC